MIKFKQLFLLTMILLSFAACNSQSTNCPECNMPINESKKHTSTLEKFTFDDIGCMILYSQKDALNLDTAKVFTNDTNRYILASKAKYSINEKTPMNYGFGAYEKDDTKKINFDLVKQKMIRGENLTNPKIRKQILGK